jgi:phage FluMu protein gp41
MPETVIKKLKKPWKVGGVEAMDIEVRPATVADTCEAELKASPIHPNAFTVEMACLQVMRAGSFTGPFAPSHFKQMSDARFRVIRDAMQEADQLGED